MSNITPTGKVTITGSATQGQTLTATHTLADADGLGTISYQWNANGSIVIGAIGNNYTLSQADLGKTMTVTASYTDGQGTAESITSTAAGKVATDGSINGYTFTNFNGNTGYYEDTWIDLGSYDYWVSDGYYEQTWIDGYHQDIIINDGYYEQVWIDDGYDTSYYVETWIDGYWTETWVEDGYWEESWIDTSGYQETWVDGYYEYEEVVVDAGHYEENWVDTSYTSQIWIDGYYQETWIDTSYYEYYYDPQYDSYNLHWVEDGYFELQDWVDGYYQDTIVNDGYYEQVWIDDGYDTSYYVETWIDGYWTETWVEDGYWEESWIDTSGYQETWVDGYYEYEEVVVDAGHYEENWVDTSYTSQIWIDGYYEENWVDTSYYETVQNGYYQQVWNNINDAPSAIKIYSKIDEHSNFNTYVTTITAIDPDGDTLEYRIEAGNTDADMDGEAAFFIDPSDGSIYVNDQEDIDLMNGKNFNLTASVSDGLLLSKNTVTVQVVNINDAPAGSVTLTGTATEGQTLTAANTLADVDGLGTISYQWKANGSAITGATGSTYTLGQAEVGKTISVTASYTDGQGTTEAVTSSATTAVANVNDAPTGTVTITSTATQGQTLTAANTLADVDGLGTISYQWKANGTAITGATGTTYTLGQADVGKTISVTASYTDAQGTAEAITSSATTAVANVNDAPTGAVTLTGTATQGQTLTAANTLADVDGLGTISYQWKANGSAITGATGTTYTLGQADVGKTISVTASYTDGQGTTEAITSSATTAVANVNDAPTGAVTITGTATQGQTLTAANTLADVDGLGTVSYQWLRGGVAITGATGSTYTLTSSDVGKAIGVQASYTDGGSQLETSTSTTVTPSAAVSATPGLVFTDTAGLQVVEGGDPTSTLPKTDTAQVALTVAPRHNVVVTMTVSDATEGLFMNAAGQRGKSVQLTFTPENWNTPKTVTIVGVDDKPHDGDVAFTISTSVKSDDLRYDGMRSGAGVSVPTITVLTLDDDVPDEQYGDQNKAGEADVIKGGNGSSDLYGLEGRDEMYGNNGDDRLYGGYGDDVLYGNADNDGLEGDQGNDKLDGGIGNDTLNGGTGNDTLSGSTGNDNLLGDVGQDTLLGGDGNDTLNGGVDADSMNGGNGADVYYIDNAADVVSDSGTDGAIDTVYIMAYLSGSLTLGNGIDNGTLDDQAGKGNLKGNSGNNALNGNTSNNVLDGGTGNDTIDGGAGVDNLTGGAGSDNLSGGLGNDVLYSGDGDDVVDAGAGNDLIIGGDGAGNDKYVGGAGVDTVKYTSATSGITVDLTKGTATSRLANDAAKIGTDTLNGIESVIAGNYNDMVNGSAVANTLRGEAGNDTLNGKAGNDTLVGGAGNDILIGGAGKDALTGSAGNDVFKFNTLTESGLTATTRDVITDFVRGQDKINLSTIDANTALAGNQAFTGLIGANVAFTKAGQLKLVAGVLYGNTDADATAEFSIALTGITTLANTDFVL